MAYPIDATTTNNIAGYNLENPFWATNQGGGGTALPGGSAGQFLKLKNTVGTVTSNDLEWADVQGTTDEEKAEIAKIAGIETNIQAINERDTIQDADLAVIKTEQTTQNTRLDGIDENLTDLTERVDAIDLSSVNTRLGTVENKVEGLQNTTQTTVENITNLTTQVTNINNNVQGTPVEITNESGFDFNATATKGQRLILNIEDNFAYGFQIIGPIATSNGSWFKVFGNGDPTFIRTNRFYDVSIYNQHTDNQGDFGYIQAICKSREFAERSLTIKSVQVQAIEVDTSDLESRIETLENDNLALLNRVQTLEGLVQNLTSTITNLEGRIENLKEFTPTNEGTSGDLLTKDGGTYRWATYSDISPLQTTTTNNAGGVVVTNTRNENSNNATATNNTLETLTMTSTLNVEE